jgi:hypothetical protein
VIGATVGTGRIPYVVRMERTQALQLAIRVERARWAQMADVLTDELLKELLLVPALQALSDAEATLSLTLATEAGRTYAERFALTMLRRSAQLRSDAQRVLECKLV